MNLTAQVTCLYYSVIRYGLFDIRRAVMRTVVYKTMVFIFLHKMLPRDKLLEGLKSETQKEFLIKKSYG